MTNQSDIKKLAEQMASSMKSFDDIKDFQKQLMQSFIDTALEAEMEEHLGYPKHEKADKPNKRNGHTKKRVRSDTGELEISTPRDRDSSFEPVLVSKHQTRISGLDDKIISFYAKGQTTTEIVETIKDIYDVDISSSLVSRVTDNILDDIHRLAEPATEQRLSYRLLRLHCRQSSSGQADHQQSYLSGLRRCS